MRKLKPCPFCGSEAKFCETSVFWVRCSNDTCGAETANGDSGTKQEAAEIWNRRVTTKGEDHV